MGEFDRALAKVLVHEGGYSNHPKDPGGATMKGVTQRVYDEFLKTNGMPTRPVKNISNAEIATIYRRKYWDEIKGDKLPAGVSYVVFDGAVNSGVGQSAKWLQRALAEMGLYKGLIDGGIGTGTLLAIEQVKDNDKLIDLICDRRLAFLKQLKTWSTFGKGWAARVAGVRAVGQAWATGAEGPALSFTAGGDAKAPVTDAKASPTLAVADAATGVGGGSFTLGGALTAAKDQLTAFAGSSAFVDNLIVGLIVGGMLVGAGSYGYRWYAARRRKERAEALDLQAVPT